MTAGFAVPSNGNFWLTNATVPACCLPPGAIAELDASVDQTVSVDIEVIEGRFGQVLPSGTAKGPTEKVSCRSGMLWPCFADLHTHIGEPEQARKPQLWPARRQEGLQAVFRG